MCLAIPGELVAITPGDLPMGRVVFGGVTKDVCVAYVPEAQVGDFVLVHAGFAIARVDAEAARATLLELARLQEEEEET
jgi:hydrogenase expression/formation protein HypC